MFGRGPAKFICTVYPNMRVKGEIQFVGGEFVTGNMEYIKLLREMAPVVQEVKEEQAKPSVKPKPEPAPVEDAVTVTEAPELEAEEDEAKADEAKADEAQEGEDVFRVPTRWTIRQIKTHATKNGFPIPEEITLRRKMACYLEDKLNGIEKDFCCYTDED